MSTRRLLVVDDDASVRDMLSELFTDAGYVVVTAEDGASALKALQENNLQVMLLDLKLPDTDGLALCRKIREFNPVACIFAMTAYTSLFELADAREAGFDDYFIKPVDIKLLRKTIGDAFDRVERWKRKG
ncbi:MAG: response regulator [Fibrobacteres bacterium]|nr:response regulator [Fibrobacterota bacterium]